MQSSEIGHLLTQVIFHSFEKGKTYALLMLLKPHVNTTFDSKVV